ncbi:MAG TPA: GNAT family N-acetyltransferase [Halanaerobiales bacterium]|nr:GNAT family N-acetyltransferase [Halanaerobiales bacterium]
MNGFEIIETNEENVMKLGLCGYKNIKREGFPEKIEWLKKQKDLGLTIKSLYSKENKTQGMIEYIPGQYCWRPVKAKDYMFIHCLFVGFKKEYKNKGYGSLMIKECIKDSKKQNFKGIAVVTRKGSFMSGKEIFIKNNFKVVDNAPPDFELLVYKFKEDTLDPKFNNNWSEKQKEYGNGLVIIRANQCPYTVKNVNEIVKTAKQEYKINAKVIDLKNYQEAQNSPCPFGTFCILFKGKAIANHPISKRRFMNIMSKEVV